MACAVRPSWRTDGKRARPKRESALARLAEELDGTLECAGRALTSFSAQTWTPGSGSFLAEDDGTTIIPMNAPWRFDRFDGWVVVEEGSRQPLLTT